jgi:hypothetical protein
MDKWLYTMSGNYISNIEHFHNNKCLKFCGEQGKYLCMKNFKHFHDVNSKQILFTAICGHCVNRPDVYYVDSNIYNLVSNKNIFNSHHK